MIVTLFSVLIFLDVVLMLIFMKLNRKNISMSQILQTLTEERDLLNSQKQELLNELSSNVSECKSYHDKVKVMATEVDQDLSRCKNILSQEVTGTIEGMRGEIMETVSSLTQKQLGVEALLKKLQQEKTILQKNIVSAKALASVLGGKASYEAAIGDLESRKYQDARELIAKGKTAQEVAEDLGLSASEIQTIMEIDAGI
jgi:hypothetical protein